MPIPSLYFINLEAYIWIQMATKAPDLDSPMPLGVESEEQYPSSLWPGVTSLVTTFLLLSSLASADNPAGATGGPPPLPMAQPVVLAYGGSRATSGNRGSAWGPLLVMRPARSPRPHAARIPTTTTP